MPKKSDIFGLRTGDLADESGNKSGGTGKGDIFGKKAGPDLVAPEMPGKTTNPGKGQHKPDWA